MRFNRDLPGLILLLTLVSPACHKQPSLSGASLECKTDLDCPARDQGWRCFENGCIENTLPTVAPLDADYVALASPAATLSKTAVATDPEGDPLTFTWTAAPGPGVGLLPAPVDGDTLTVTPTDEGIFEFDVVAKDGYGVSMPVRYRLIVQPDLGAVYVSTRGADGPTCGGITAPCASISFGADLAATRPNPRVLVAAVSGGTDYAECLDISGAVVVTGCYDPDTWTYLAEERDRCSVRCNLPDGHATNPSQPTIADIMSHRLQGTATLRDLSLTLDPSVVPVLNPFTPDEPRDTFGVVTLFITGGAPSIEDVDVRVADCGAGCSGVGVGSVYASPTLTGVDVAGLIEGFDPMDLFVGMLFYGGAPTVSGDASHPTPRGKIVMNLPTTGGAVGVMAALSVLTLDGISIHGGLAPFLVGVNSLVGRTTLDDVDVDLTGLGARNMYGILASACSTTSTGPDACDCSTWFPDCPATEPAWPTAPSLTLINTRVRVQAPSSAGAGLRPCVGAAVQANATVVSLTIDGDTEPVDEAGSRIEVGDDFTLALGLIIEASAGATLPFSVANTRIQVGSADVDDVCMFQAQQQGNTDFPAGAIGVVLGKKVGGTLEGNRISTGANELLSLGVAMFGAATVDVRRNAIDVAHSDGRQMSAAAVGVLIAEDGATEGSPSTFEGNRVSIGPDAENAAAVSHGGSPYWRFVNNSISGGGAFQSLGLAFMPTSLAAAFPVFEHNTISGGGDQLRTATSRALQLLAPESSGGGPVMDPVLPVFSNNLLDAGNAHGRRILLDNYANQPIGPGATGNRGQFDGAAIGPRPGLLVPGLSGYLAAPSASTASTIAWWTLAANSSELMQVIEIGAGGVSEPNLMTLGDIVPLAGPVGPSWAGRLRARDYLVVTQPGSLAVSQIDSVARPVFEEATTAGFDPITNGFLEHTPTAVAAAFLNTDPLIDLLFLDGAGIWVLYRDPAGSFKAPALLVPNGGVAPITAFAVDPDGSSLVILAGSTVAMVSGSGDTTTAPMSFTLPDVPEAVTTVLLTYMGEEVVVTDKPFGPRFLDAVIIAKLPGRSTEVFVFNDPFDGNVVRRTPFQSTNPIPCGAGTIFGTAGYTASAPTAVWVDKIGTWPQDQGLQLLVGCADGRVELFHTVLVAALPPYELRRVAVPATSTPAAAVTGITTNAFENAGTRRIAVSRAGRDQIATYNIELNSVSGLNDVLEQLQLVLRADVAWRDPDDGQLKPDFSGGGPAGLSLQPAAAGQPRACDFVGGPTYDLHRASDTEPACRAPRLSGVSRDIDGGVRGDPTDIGADEFGVP